MNLFYKESKSKNKIYFFSFFLGGGGGERGRRGGGLVEGGKGAVSVIFLQGIKI